MTKGCRRVSQRVQQASYVDDGDALRSGGGHKDLRLVGRDGNAPGQGVVAVEFVERDLDSFADVVAEQRERIAEGPAVLDVRERNQILGAKLRGHAELAVCRKRHMKHARHVVQRLALDHHLPRGVDDGDF